MAERVPQIENNNAIGLDFHAYEHSMKAQKEICKIRPLYTGSTCNSALQRFEVAVDKDTNLYEFKGATLPYTMREIAEMGDCVDHSASISS